LVLRYRARDDLDCNDSSERIDVKIGILGTGMVGETLGTKFAQLGHQVKMGSRTANNEKAVNWAKTAGANASQGTFIDASNFGEMIFICLKGAAFLEIVPSVAPALAGKVVVDVSNPLDFSSGSLTLSICNTNSLGEEVQKALPAPKIVKSFNTVNCEVMVNPGKGGNPTMFVCGNDAGAKKQFTDLIRTLGWQDIIDIGDITKSRGTEALMHLWMNLYQTFGTPHFGWKVVRASET
jgi:8-hydroxy-5-deazaflavin:NADPH oxidoreductase